MKAFFASFFFLIPVLAVAADSTLSQRMERASSALLGTRYTLDPLGEGESARYDRDPRFRTDAFDCTTFVESVIAIAKATTKSEIIPWLDSIRYKDGIVSFETRNHLPGVDWIQNNLATGLLEDITEEIAPGQTEIAQTLIERDEWYRSLKATRLSGIAPADRRARLRELQSLSANHGKEIERIVYIKRSALFANPDIAAKIPDGSVVNLVRPGWDIRYRIGTRLNISHQGLVFHRQGVVYFRHASSSGTVMESRLLDYLRQTRVIAGINVLVVR